MRIVIDIPEDLKKMIFDDDVFDIAHSYRLAMCVKNGTPLPKGHGRLYDEKAIRKGIKNPYQCETVLDGLKLVKPIIEAEGEDK